MAAAKETKFGTEVGWG